MLLVAFAALTTGYGLLKPLGESPDETAHMRLIRFVGQTGRPPLDADRQAAGYKSDVPILYHLLTGSLLHWVDYDALPTWRESSTDPRSLLIADGLSPWSVIHTEDEAWPWRGVILGWHLARLVSTALSTLTVWVVYRAALALVTMSESTRIAHARWWALGVAAVVAFNPQFSFIASSASDDNLLGLLMALFAWSLIRAWHEPRHWRPWVAGGVCLGLALTTKYSMALVVLAVPVGLIICWRRGCLSPIGALGRLIVCGTALGLVSAWWFGFRIVFFNRVDELGLVPGLVAALADHADVSAVQAVSFLQGTYASSHTAAINWLDWLVQTVVTFWLPGVPLDHGAGVAFSAVVALLSVAAVAGLVRCAVTTSDWPAAGWPRGLLAMQVALLVPFPVLRYYLSGNINESAQGRHILFPAAVPIALLLAAGLSAWLSPQRRHIAPLTAAGVLVAINLANFFGLMLPAYPEPLPVRTGAAGQTATPVHVTFGDSGELVGVDVGAWTAHGALPVTLAWRSLGYSGVDYLTDLFLVDTGGAVQARWLGHPVNGRYPIRAWEPGDVVRDEVWLVAPGLAAGEYRLCLRLLPATMAARPEPVAGDCPLLTRVTLPSAPSPGGDDRGSGYTVWQSGAPGPALPIYRHRATIQVSLGETPAGPGAPSGELAVALVGPDDAEQAPVLQTGRTYSFLVGARWPSGIYRLRIREGARSVDSAPALEVRVRARNFDVPPISHRVDAHFGDEIALLGFDFPERRVQPGGALPITLYWQAQRDIQAHYIVFNHLLSADQRQWGGRDRIPRDYYSTALWTAGEVVRDDYNVPVDPAAPPGIYHLDVGLYELLGGQMHPLWLTADGQALDANSVFIESIKVGGPPPDVTVVAPAPEHPRADRLGDVVTLLGFDLTTQPDRLEIVLYWRCDARLEVDYTTFVHIAAGSGDQPPEVAAQMDRPPADGAYPTSLWDVGDVVRDVVEVPLPDDLPPGDYSIRVGLYDAATGQRLPVTASHGVPVAGGAVPLTTVRLGDGH